MKKLYLLFCILPTIFSLTCCSPAEFNPDLMKSYIEEGNIELKTLQLDNVSLKLVPRSEALVFQYILHDMNATFDLEMATASLQSAAEESKELYLSILDELNREVHSSAYLIVEYITSDDIILYTQEYRPLEEDPK